MKYSRRNFIKTASVVTLGTLIPKESIDALNTISDVLNWKLGTSLSLTTPNIEETMRILKRAGIDYVEAVMHSSKDMELAEVVTLVNNYKKAADAVGITIWSIHIPYGWDFDISLPDPILRERSRQSILLTLRLAKGFGSYQKAILHPSFEPIDETLRLAHIASFRTCLKELGPLVEDKYKVRLAIECLPRTCLGNRAAEMIALVGDIPSVDVCMDTNHLLGEKTEYFAEQLNSRIQTIHVSDYDEVNERHWLPGKGVINFPAVIDALVKSGYKGPFMFEVSREGYEDDMQKYANDLVLAWTKLISQLRR
ncbi:MAG: sugar phosphate isomerase/epimerase [Parabacteroides sp.]|nr:sugar phosphate isomerase/epimerase [Parabacteroides sp.]